MIYYIISYYIISYYHIYIYIFLPGRYIGARQAPVGPRPGRGGERRGLHRVARRGGGGES